MRRTAVRGVLKRGSILPPPTPPSWNPPRERPARDPEEVPRLKRPAPPGLRMPYVIRPFIKDQRKDELQGLENTGMFAEELTIERGRFPRFHKSLVVHTDGAVSEKEFDYPVPPYVVLFRDRLSLYKARRLALAKAGKANLPPEWQTLKAGVPPPTPKCNALEFPFCVPTRVPLRAGKRDPLEGVTEEDDEADEATSEALAEGAGASAES